MEKHRFRRVARRWSLVLSSLTFTFLCSNIGVTTSSAATSSPNSLFQIAMGNAAAKKFVVINMTGTNAAGNFHNVWRSNPNSGYLVQSDAHPGATGHVYVTVLDRIVYEKIDTVQWAYAGLGAKYKAYENKWFVLRKSSASYKSFLEQEVTSGALLIPIDGTQFTIQDNTVLHGVKVIGLEGALTGSNPPVPVTLCVTRGKHPLPLQVSVPRTAKNKNVWTATFTFRSSASPIAKPAATLTFP